MNEDSKSESTSMLVVGPYEFSL